MAKAQNKTTQIPVLPADFIAGLQDGPRKDDAQILLTWFTDQTGMEPRMWGPSIIGYGRYHYKYESGREGQSMMTGFSPRKANLSLYIMPGYAFGDMEALLNRLGKHKRGKSCLYINKISDVDMNVLSKIVSAGMTRVREKYETWDV
jgi:hypothetical protein